MLYYVIRIQNVFKMLSICTFQHVARKGKNQSIPRTFSAPSDRINMLKKYCKGTNPSAQCGIDMTYKCGDFFCTLFAFAHPVFVHATNRKKHPGIIAAIATTTTRDYHDYHYIASQLNQCGIKSLTYITDGELAMEKGK